MSMEDKIVVVKKRIIRIASDNDYYTRITKYKKIKNIISELNNEEKNILYNELKRDYETYRKLGGIKNIVSVFMSSISMIIATVSIYFKDADKETVFNSSLILLVWVLLCSCLAIFFVGVFDIYCGKKRSITKYIIDVFKDEK